MAQIKIHNGGYYDGYYYAIYGYYYASFQKHQIQEIFESFLLIVEV